MAFDYCKLPPRRSGFALAKCTDGDGDREELLKAVGEHEQ